MLDNVMTQKGLTKQVDKKFAENLITWADIIRKTFYEGGVDEIISTRRLVHIVDAYAIFKDKMKSIQMCTNRFDNDTKTSFIDLYTKIDGGEDVSNWLQSDNTIDEDSDDTVRKVMLVTKNSSHNVVGGAEKSASQYPFCCLTIKMKYVMTNI